MKTKKAIDLTTGKQILLGWFPWYGWYEVIEAGKLKVGNVVRSDLNCLFEIKDIKSISNCFLEITYKDGYKKRIRKNKLVFIR
jgi:hypothetical protein